MQKKIILPILIACIFCLGLGNNADATPIHMTGIVAGGSVDVYAEFTPGTDSITVDIWNATLNPKNVGQNISDLFFVLSTGETTGSLTDSSGLERTVNSNKTYSDGSVVSTGWGLESNYTFGSETGLRLYVLGTPSAPAHTIIGLPSGSSYTNAHGSIAGNSPHNPFLFGDSNNPVTFSLSIPGITTGTTITYAAFSFGTSEGEWLKPPQVPEPASMILLGLGLIGLAGIRRKFRK